MNMVSTVDGKATLGTTAAGIGSRTDWALMRQLRASVDAVMFGGGTLRAEGVDPRVDAERSRERVLRGQTQQPLAVAVSGSLSLPLTHRFLVNGPANTVILTTTAASTDRQRQLAPYATVLSVGDTMVDLAAAVRRLYADYGVRRLLSEGGPTLNQALLDAGLIDEVFWTVAPKLAGGRGRALIESNEPSSRIRARLELVSLYEDTGELFTRYRLLRDADGAYRI